ncbi:GlsB/YeaQ/YmgE family stress response membrane protein [Ancylobacter terrae]|uniref:GlsB/YeaQ/YmgE family stress response membrane protein n=1 Tax=Ancylobacter sp. sgz301288 TaxID=3342077 RepID=UPI00385FE32C
MSVLGWILLGLIAGWLGSKLVNKSGQGMLLDIVLGIVGAVVGGVIFNFFGAAGVTGFNIWSLIVAVIGSVVVLWLYHQLSGRRSL